MRRHLVLAATLLFAAVSQLAEAQDRAYVPGAMAGERLVWSDEFDPVPGTTTPSAHNWVFETGDNGWGNHELEMYCAPGAAKPPCDPGQPNAYVAADGMLHLVLRPVGEGSAVRYTSARLKTAGLQSFQYGRIEARIRIPGGAGLWPAFWMLGDDIDTSHPWPACGEIDIMENIGREPGTVHGSLHGTGFPPEGLTGLAMLPGHRPFHDSFHRFGMIWSPERIQFYVDDASRPYASFTPANMPPHASWPFDGRRFFILLNLAIGGDWPGPPDRSTALPAEMLVDYVRVWQRSGTP